MTDLERFAGFLPSRRLTSIPPDGEEVSVDALARLGGAIRIDGDTAVHSALRETLLRLGETHILSSPKLAGLIGVWDSVVGTAEQRIIKHLEEMLGVSPHQDLVSYVFNCLS